MILGPNTQRFCMKNLTVHCEKPYSSLNRISIILLVIYNYKIMQEIAKCERFYDTILYATILYIVSFYRYIL